MTFPVASPILQRALHERGYIQPTAVQMAVLHEDAKNRDLLVSAQTGSGKTVAYGLAFAPDILGEAEMLPAAGAPLVLVIAPTRELAIQVHRELDWLYRPAGGRVASCVGGMDPRREQRTLAEGCHIVVGTPGRLQDHLNRGRLKLSSCRVVVLDEADEMLDLGFKDELEFILQAAPEPRRTLLFSATIAKEIATLARQYQVNALRIDTGSRNQPHADIEYRAIRVHGHEIEQGLVNVLRFHEARGSLVFCATREAVRRVQGRLQERGFAAVALSGELSQNERNNALQSLRDGRARVCIATDVAARGLDLPDLDLVIHADLPTNKATLLHRSGRTGRAGRKGLCLLLVPNSKRRRAELLLSSANINATWEEPPSPESIRLRDQERLMADPLLNEAPLDEDIALAKQLIARQGADSVATALIRLYRARLPAPEEITPSPETHAAPRASRAMPYNSTTQWFSAQVGRKNNADPKWLIPVFCRLGGITKSDIGSIKVMDHETKFEIAAAAAGAFAAKIRTAGDSELQIIPATAPQLESPQRGGAEAARHGFAKRQPAKAAKKLYDGRPNEQARRRRNKQLVKA